MHNTQEQIHEIDRENLKELITVIPVVVETLATKCQPNGVVMNENEVATALVEIINHQMPYPGNLL